jgi:hypothetical protein
MDPKAKDRRWRTACHDIGGTSVFGDEGCVFRGTRSTDRRSGSHVVVVVVAVAVTAELCGNVL